MNFFRLPLSGTLYNVLTILSIYMASQKTLDLKEREIGILGPTGPSRGPSVCESWVKNVQTQTLR